MHTTLTTHTHTTPHTTLHNTHPWQVPVFSAAEAVSAVPVPSHTLPTRAYGGAQFMGGPALDPQAENHNHNHNEEHYQVRVARILKSDLMNTPKKNAINI